MTVSLVTAGVAVTVAAVTLVVLGWFAQPGRARFPVHGWVGLAMMLAGELLVFRQVEPLFTYFTPWQWTGYILAVDAGVFSLRGKSLLRSDRRRFAGMALLSIPLWLIFEGYNLHLKNWVYHGPAMGLLEESLARGWAYATIVPALLESADLLAALGWAKNLSARGWRWFFGVRRGLMVVGASFLIVPLLLPQRLAVYSFALVWLGFVFLLEPLNFRRGHDSLLRDLERNRGQRIYCLFAAGLLCGFLWEFWNYWAGARWEYIFPVAQEWKMFAMPLPGYLGFPPFAIECFALFNFCYGELGRLVRKH
ncbi:MAG: hypothetical protein V3R29_01675 [Candidatus Acidoferrales bacterium]